jgi:glycosyltransferase involved in cell wall biosynthesis
MSRLPLPLRPIFALSARRQRARDYAAAQKVDAFIANSDYIGQRIRRYYGRESITIHPPGALQAAPPLRAPGDFYLTVGRLVPGKRTDLLIGACNRLGRKLVVAGDGPERSRLQAMAGPHVTLAGRVSDERLAELYGSARAFLFAADEDFGISTVEAQSWGLPAIAYGHGGSLEILDESGPVRDAVFFSEQSVDSVTAAIERFETIEHQFDHDAIHYRAERFSETRFREQLLEHLSRILAESAGRP